MEQQSYHERILIVLAILLCAVIVGYNAFYVPQANAPTVIYVESLPEQQGETSQKEQEVYTPQPPPSHGIEGEQLLNLNTATAQELSDSLPGVGEVTAQRIVEYREEHGAFYSVEELLNVAGIGEKTLEKLRAYVTVE